MGINLIGQLLNGYNFHIFQVYSWNLEYKQLWLILYDINIKILQIHVQNLQLTIMLFDLSL